MSSIEPVEIHECSAEWVDEFQRIGARLRESLGNMALRIDHIGSTSVVGLAAKPIIDIQISVLALDPMEPFLAPLESLGYVWQQDNLEKTERYFKERPGERKTHIHVRLAGSWHEQFALLFRDYIRKHPDNQREYERVKKSLAQWYLNQRQEYTKAKVPIIWGIMRKADQWAADTGWQPGPSDA